MEGEGYLEFSLGSLPQVVVWIADLLIMVGCFYILKYFY